MALENRDYEQQIFQAPAGVGNDTDPTTIKSGAGKYTEITDENGNVIAKFDNATKKTTLDNAKVENGLEVGGNETVSGNQTVEGNSDLQGDVTLGSDNNDIVTIRGTTTLKENATLEKDLSVDGSTLLNGNVTLGDSPSDSIIVKGTMTMQDINTDGDLNVKGNTTLGDSSTDTTTIKGSTHLERDLSVSGDTNLDGNVIIGDSSADTTTIKSVLIQKENSLFEKELTVQGDTTLGSDATDTVQIAGTSEFLENSTFNKDIEIKGSTVLDNELDVKGDTTFEKDVNIQGSATFGTDCNDAVIVNGKPTFKCDVAIEKNLSVDGDLTVRGNTTLGDGSADTITVNGTPTFKEDVVMDKKLLVKGNIINLRDSNTGIYIYDNHISLYDTSDTFVHFYNSITYNPTADVELRTNIQGISQYEDSFDPIPSSYLVSNTILGITTDIKNASFYIKVQGFMASIHFIAYDISGGFSKALPTNDNTDITIKLNDLLATHNLEVDDSKQAFYVGVATFHYWDGALHAPVASTEAYIYNGDATVSHFGSLGQADGSAFTAKAWALKANITCKIKHI